MRRIGSPTELYSHSDDGVTADDYRAARRYLRYYQRGLVTFAAALCAGVVVQQTWLAGTDARIIYLSLAGAAFFYATAPYSQKVRRRIAPVFDLLDRH